jgi:REP element-mobilizing transposase RayT
MPRAARIVFSSMPYHITSRGNERKKIFLKDELDAKSSLLVGFRE